MIDATEVHWILDALSGLTVWVDGGWGVDALAGRQNRGHNDLDLVVRTAELPAVREALASLGFVTVLRDWLPAALALADGTGREVDLHPVDSSSHQHLPDGSLAFYPPPVTGSIGGRRVLCVDRETQLRHHTGYPLRDKDLADLEVLRAITGASPARRGASGPGRCRGGS